MTVQERLNEVAGMIRMRAYDIADKRIDALYEDYSRKRVQLTEEQTDYMFHLINVISNYWYGC